MKGSLNIFRDNFLEKEELDRLISFIKDNPALFLFVSSTQNFGVIQQDSPTTVDPAFKVEAGTNLNTIKIVTDSYALDNLGQLIYQRPFDNLPVATDSTWYWVKISHRYDNYEEGYVSIAVDGTLSGVNTSFTEVLRGASSGFPVKIKLFTQADDGSLTAANNDGIYEVVSVESDNTALIAGSFVAEENLRYVVLGAFSIKTSTGDITSNGIYSYDSCQIDFIEEEEDNTPPETNFVEGEEFYIARVYSDGSGVTIQDKRIDYYFRINFGDIVVSNKAEVDASNLSAPDIAAWLVKLGLYTFSQIDTLISALMVKSANLNDLTNTTTARNNLSVYSKSYIDQFGTVITRKIVEIGDWNMDSTLSVNVAHGLTFSKIRSVRVSIRADSAVGNYVYDISYESIVTGKPGGTFVIDDTNVILYRLEDGVFDDPDFDATSYNRGWILIDYIP